MSVEIIVSDCRKALRAMPAESVHCVVTSPPYWGLRDYGVDGQLGMERTLGEHIEVMVDVFREVRRVLRKDGTLWLNYGDCYATAPNGRSAAETKAIGEDDRTFRDKPFSTVGPIYDPNGGQVPDTKNPKARAGQSSNKSNIGGDHGGRIRAGGALKPKDLCMVPARLAIALQEDGWWVRSEIIWAKPNPMPESIRDRPTSAHEKVYLLTKGQRYFYDAEAVRENWSSGRDDMRANGLRTGGAYVNQRGPQNNSDKQSGHGRRHAGFNDRWAMSPVQGRNLRNVWTIATAPFPEAHFATFPPALVEPCIKAGCPEDGIVLDPFGGSGTVGLVADRLGRNVILIELNEHYAAMARSRIDTDSATRGRGPEALMRGDDLPLFGVGR